MGAIQASFSATKRHTDIADGIKSSEVNIFFSISVTCYYINITASVVSFGRGAEKQEDKVLKGKLFACYRK